MSVRQDKEPIFVLGAPRSGTTLIAAMLAAHGQLSCGPETRFFHFLAQTNSSQLYTSWPDKAVDFLFSIILMEPIPRHYGLTREQLCSFLQRRAPSIPAILGSLTEQFMLREGKNRWVEKSPEHLMYVGDIRRWFPKSPIVRILRDPRDVALSMTKTPWAPQDFLDALMLWRKYDDKSAPFFETDLNSCTLHYESLIESPETEMAKLCAFIGEEYEPQMLDTSRSASRVVTEQESWKELARKPVDGTRSKVWKRELSQAQNRTAEALIGDRLIAYGFECAERLDCAAEVFPSVESLLQHRKPLNSFVNQGVRFWQIPHEDRNHLTLYVGEPDADSWLRHGKPGRWVDALRVMIRILKEKLGHRRVYWVQDRELGMQRGYCGRMLALVFRLTAERPIV